MLMSHPAISAGVAARPRFGVSRAAEPAHPVTTTTEPTRTSALRVNILDLAIRLHAPGLDRVVVVDDVGAVLGDQLIATGLDAAGVIRRATLEHVRGAVPLPGDPEAHQRVREHGS